MSRDRARRCCPAESAKRVALPRRNPDPSPGVNSFLASIPSAGPGYRGAGSPEPHRDQVAGFLAGWADHAAAGDRSLETAVGRRAASGTFGVVANPTALRAAEAV